ncbi:MAG: hypothetical protein HC910_02665 [Spirulinaceae cyanobacterium SM2_1_0]|nr:hypothetical protein [Spirulinaceae cyanobacterium SM2_1_0]
MTYLNPVPHESERNGDDLRHHQPTRNSRSRRVVDRDDLQPFIPGFQKSF